MAMGQLKGTMIVTTPMGWWEISTSVGGPGRVSTASTSSARPQASSVRWTSPIRSKVDSPTTLPFSAERIAASASEFSMIAPAASVRCAARSAADSAAQAGKASFAAATASRAWSRVAAAASPTTSEGRAGLVIVRVRSLWCSRPP